MTTKSTTPAEHLDLLIVGAGLSGIGAACHLTTQHPGKRYVILESRREIGGTWSLFQYPGVRSDSDMYTFGYSFRPWTGAKSISDGTSILTYLRDTATEYGIERHIRFEQRVVCADWSSSEARWLVEVEIGASRETARYSGQALQPSFPLLSFTSGYVLRALGQFPRQSGKAPWKLRQNYFADLLNLRLRAIDDGTLVFSKGGQAEMAAVPE